MTYPPSPLLMILVTAIAFLYASVGFGGATGYLAMTSLFELEPDLMASTALLLNIVVAGIALINYTRAGHLDKRLLLTFPLASVPAAFLGGYFKLNEALYFLLLYITLTYVTLRMLIVRDTSKASRRMGLRPPPAWLALVTGATIGLLSGMIGIGGGIILSPVIILARWGTPKQAATTAAGFILLNSISALVGRFIGGNLVLNSLGVWLLPFGVFGALGGSYLGARRLPSIWARRILGLVLLAAVVRFWMGWLK